MNTSRPTLVSLAFALVAAFVAVPALAAPAGAATVWEAAVKDPATDTQFASRTAARTYAGLDVTSVKYRFSDGRFRARVKVADLTRDNYTPGREANELKEYRVMLDVGHGVELWLDARNSGVEVTHWLVDEDGFTSWCDAGSAAASFAKDIVRYSVPVSCLTTGFAFDPVTGDLLVDPQTEEPLYEYATGASVAADFTVWKWRGDIGSRQTLASDETKFGRRVTFD